MIPNTNPLGQAQELQSALANRALIGRTLLRRILHRDVARARILWGLWIESFEAVDQARIAGGAAPRLWWADVDWAAWIAVIGAWALVACTAGYALWRAA